MAQKKKRKKSNTNYQQQKAPYSLNQQHIQQEVQKQKQRTRLNFAGRCYLAFCITFVAYVFSSVGLKAYNNYLNVQKQILEREIEEIKINLEIAKNKEIELSSYDRIKEVAEKEGLKTEAKSILIIKE